MKNSIESMPWGTFEGKQVTMWKLVNANGVELDFINWGGRLIKAIVPDRNGKLENVTLGWPTLDEYVAENGGTYYGALVGRYGNRIGKGKFTLNGEEYTLELNNEPGGIPCALHGGLRGFSLRMWNCYQEIHTEDLVGLILEITSPDGEGGYPGNVSLFVKLTLDNNNVWRIEYNATTDSATHLAFTEHAYWNLDGVDAGTTIMDHKLRINSDFITEYEADMIPTGKLRDVTSTPFDFREPRTIGSMHDEDYDQLKYGAGYDMNWVLHKDGKEEDTYNLGCDRYRLSSNSRVNNDAFVHACTLTSEKTGRELEVWTTEPGVQLYDGYYLPVRNAGLAIETQHFPDTPNKPAFPSTLLLPGEVLHSVTEYRFKMIGE